MGTDIILTSRQKYAADVNQAGELYQDKYTVIETSGSSGYLYEKPQTDSSTYKFKFTYQIL